MDFEDIGNALYAIYKDSLSKKQIEEFKLKAREVLEADVEARRAEKKELILSIASLRQKLDWLKCTYSLIQQDYGSCGEVESLIESVEKDIDDLRRQKNGKIVR